MANPRWTSQTLQPRLSSPVSVSHTQLVLNHLTQSLMMFVHSSEVVCAHSSSTPPPERCVSPETNTQRVSKHEAAAHKCLCFSDLDVCFRPGEYKKDELLEAAR